jgi:hypothetical protein
MKRSTADTADTYFLLSQLQKEFDVAIIDRNGFFEYTPGILRALVDPDHFTRLAFDLAKLKDCRFHNAEVLAGVLAAQPLLQQYYHSRTKEHYRTHAVDPQAVTARASVGGEVYAVPYDHLVVACGSSYPGAIRPGPREWQAESRAEGLRGEAQR